MPRRAISAIVGRTTRSTTSSASPAGAHGNGAYAPIPPVLGPVSPSPTRLKSCAGTSGTTVVPSIRQNSETSGPSRNSSITTRCPAACRSASARSVGDDHALARGELVVLDDVRRLQPVEDCRHLGRRVGYPVAGGRNAGGGHDLLGERLASLERGGRGARAEDLEAGRPKVVGDAGDQRSLRSDDDEVGGDLGSRVDRGDQRQDGGDRGDARVAWRAEQRGDRGVAGQRQAQRVLAPAATDDKDPHGGEATCRRGSRAAARVATSPRASRR